MQNEENLRSGTLIPFESIEEAEWFGSQANIIERTRYEPISTTEVLRFRYKNWRGEIADRSVIPVRTTVAVSIYHNDGKPCWIMTAYDTEKNELRDFALKDIIKYYDLI